MCCGFNSSNKLLAIEVHFTRISELRRLVLRRCANTYFRRPEALSPFHKLRRISFCSLLQKKAVTGSFSMWLLAQQRLRLKMLRTSYYHFDCAIVLSKNAILDIRNLRVASKNELSTMGILVRMNLAPY